MKDVTIKEAKSCDIALINEIMLNSLSHWSYTKEELNKIMDLYKINEDYLVKNPVYLVYEKEILLGFFCFIKNKFHENELDYFIIKNELIGRGYGRMMWEACCDKAKLLMIKEFKVMSTPDAKSFYQKMGAQEIGFCQSKIRKSINLPLLNYKLQL